MKWMRAGLLLLTWVFFGVGCGAEAMGSATTIPSSTTVQTATPMHPMLPSTTAHATSTHPVTNPVSTPSPTLDIFYLRDSVLEPNCESSVTTEINGCASAHLWELEARMFNILILIRRYFPENWPALRGKHVTWLDLVQADCYLIQEIHRYGTIRGLMGISCYAHHYETRIDLLQGMLCPFGNRNKSCQDLALYFFPTPSVSDP